MVDIRQFDGFLTQSQWGSRDAITEWQREQLAALLRHARDTVPFYGFRLSKIFTRTGLVDWDRWHDIPILTRRDLSAHYDRLRSRRPVAAHGLVNELHSTGSTGTPIRFQPTQLMLGLSGACLWRAQRWHGVDWSKDILNRVYVERPGTKNGDRLGPWGPPWDRRAQKGASIYSSAELTTAEFYDAVRAAKAPYVSAASSMLADICRYNQAAREPVAAEAFFSRGEAISTAEIDLVRRSFGARVIELYSAKESGSIAHRCPEENVWHLNEETVLVEILDDANQPCAPGQEGRVVVTPFGSSMMPLIRYELGDLAAFGEKCACGRELRTLDRISGRVSQNFRHPVSGDLVSWYPVSKLQPLLAVDRWQVAQTGPDTFEVRIARTEPFPAPVVDDFITHFRAGVFPEAQVRLVYGAPLTLGRGDKLLEYKNEWGGPQG